MAAATATVAAAVSIGATAATTGFSFAQARKQNQLRREAESKAEEMMADARKKLDVNFYQQLAIQKEPYELERQALISAGAQAIEAGVESERGAAATAGRVQMAQQAGQRDIAAAMGQEMLGLEKLTAEEESRLRDLQVQLNLEDVAGAQMAAAQASDAANIAQRQAVEGVISLGQQAVAAVPLFTKTQGARQVGQIQKMGSNEFGLNQSDIQKSVASLGKVNNYDLSKVGEMNPMQFNDFMSKMDVNTLKQIKGMLPTTFKSFNPNYVPQNQYLQPEIQPNTGIQFNPLNPFGI